MSPALYGTLASGAYFSCKRHCDQECPYPGTSARAPNPAMPGLEKVDASDGSFIMRLLQPSSRGGGGGVFGEALSTIFQM